METQDIIFLSVIVSLLVIYYAGLWRVFQKAGEQGWKAIVPFYNSVTHLKIIGKEWYNVFILLIPGINIIYFLFGMLSELYRSFGREKFSDQLLGIFFFPFFVAFLGFSKDEKYIGPGSKIPKPAKTQGREWADAILFAVIAATIIRWLLLEAFKIPTPSMERTLLMGDFLFVSKVNYGARTPQTPLQMPLTHQTWWWSDNSKSYSDLIKLPQYRLPGLSKVENNDVVVFNWPADNAHDPVDLKTNYIKRCIAIAGDSLQIQNKKVFVNGKLVENPTEAQYIYKVYTQDPFSKKTFRKYKIPNYRINDQYDYRKIHGTFEAENKRGYYIDLTPQLATQLVKDGVADSVQLTTNTDPLQRQALFPMSKLTQNWTIDDYGPLWIPKKGATIKMDENNVQLYGKTIQDYEEVDGLFIEDNKLIINGKIQDTYTFKKDYYFMMGDNRHSSYDSRFWGFVPENFVVGKALFIWFSMDPDPNQKVFEAIRWDRIFDGIK